MNKRDKQANRQIMTGALAVVAIVLLGGVVWLVAERPSGGGSTDKKSQPVAATVRSVEGLCNLYKDHVADLLPFGFIDNKGASAYLDKLALVAPVEQQENAILIRDTAKEVLATIDSLKAANETRSDSGITSKNRTTLVDAASNLSEYTKTHCAW